MDGKHLIVFTCNWHAYQDMEMAGALKYRYDTRVLPVRLTCLGRISAGIILKAFEQGALGVLLLGCPGGTCQYKAGYAHAEEVTEQAKIFLDLLGYSKGRLKLRSLSAESELTFVEAVNTFLDDLDNMVPVPTAATSVSISS